MFGFPRTITLDKKEYYELLETRHKTGLQEGFKDGYQTGYAIAKTELPQKLEDNIRLLVSILEKIECSIEIHEDEFYDFMYGNETIRGEFGEYTLNTKEIIVKVSPMAYAVRGTGSVVDDIREVIEKARVIFK